MLELMNGINELIKAQNNTCEWKTLGFGLIGVSGVPPQIQIDINLIIKQIEGLLGKQMPGLYVQKLDIKCQFNQVTIFSIYD